MKKYITLAALLAAGSAFANADTKSLFLDGEGKLIGAGTRLGGASNEGSVTSQAFTSETTYGDLVDLFTEANTWYVTAGYNSNVGDNVTASADAVVFVAGGPSGWGYTAGAGIKFDLESALGVELDEVDGDITLSFDIARHAGNNTKNHQISVGLFTDYGAETEIFDSKTGDDLLPVDTFETVSFLIDPDSLESAELVFAVFADNVTGSNTGVAMKNFNLSYTPIPEPSAFGLLAGLGALALVGARRRRK